MSKPALFALALLASCAGHGIVPDATPSSVPVEATRIRRAPTSATPTPSPTPSFSSLGYITTVNSQTSLQINFLPPCAIVPTTITANTTISSLPGSGWAGTFIVGQLLHVDGNGNCSGVVATNVIVKPTPTPAPSATPSPTPAPTATPKPTATPSPTPTPVPTATPAPTPTPGGSVVWQAGSASLGHWIKANTNQCGTPVVSGASFTFALSISETDCDALPPGRNQAMPVDASGNLIRLNDGSTYSWSFDYIDGKPDGSGPGMGQDTGEAQSLVWQMHPYNAGASGEICPTLGFFNNSNGIGTGPQNWMAAMCDASQTATLHEIGSYTPGETDHWQIVVYVEPDATGWAKYYRNGTLIYSFSGPTRASAAAQPWWNFGPYKWRWEMANGGGSTMTQINATINNLVLTSP